MKFEYFIALKHLTHRKKTGLIPLISFISMAGIAVGVMALIVVLAVMSGFDRELKSKIIGMQPHLIVEKFGGMDDAREVAKRINELQLPGFQSARRFTQGQGIIRSQTNAFGVVVRGMEEEGEEFAVLKDHLESGHIRFGNVQIKLSDRSEPIELGQVVIGQTLAQILGVRVGDPVYVISPNLGDSKSLLPTGAKTLPFQVAGIYKMGMNDFDAGLALVSLDKASDLFGLGGKVTGLGIKFKDAMKAEALKRTVQSQLRYPYFVKSWIDLNRNFFSALKMEKVMMTILMTLVVLVAAFNIVSTLTMVVMEKTKDIGILRAIGATRRSIRLIFMLQGFTQGIIGVVLGTTAGLLLAARLNDVADFLERTFHFEVFPKDVYYFDKIPTQIGTPDVIFIVSFALLLSILAGVYPAHRASRVNVVEAIRYE